MYKKEENEDEAPQKRRIVVFQFYCSVCYSHVTTHSVYDTALLNANERGENGEYGEVTRGLRIAFVVTYRARREAN